MGYIINRLKERDKKHSEEIAQRNQEYNSIKEGVRAILRDRIIQSCNYLNQIGCITTPQLENIELLYESYKGLGGNGVITSLHNQTMKLRIVTEDEFRRMKEVMK